MAKSGQARVLSPSQQQERFSVIKTHRHPEKNLAIMQISFRLGLRAQEIALLQVKEVAQLNPTGTDFKLTASAHRNHRRRDTATLDWGAIRGHGTARRCRCLATAAATFQCNLLRGSAEVHTGH